MLSSVHSNLLLFAFGEVKAIVFVISAWVIKNVFESCNCLNCRQCRYYAVDRFSMLCKQYQSPLITPPISMRHRHKRMQSKYLKYGFFFQKAILTVVWFVFAMYRSCTPPPRSLVFPKIWFWEKGWSPFFLWRFNIIISHILLENFIETTTRSEDMKIFFFNVNYF